MNLYAALKMVILLVITSILAACAAPPPVAERMRMDELAQAILTMSPEISSAEATRAATIAYDYPLDLAERYKVTDPPLIHNTKVNMGLRPRGLCWHWADDLQARLALEDFETLEFHRAIANFQNPLRIEHSTLIVSARGADMFQGIVLDPWREGGHLVWVPTQEDPTYVWRPRGEVLALKREKRQTRQPLGF